MRIKLLALAVLLFCGALAGCRSTGSALTGSTEDKSPIIIEINGSPEHQSAFERFIKARLSDFATQGAQSQADIDQLRSRLLDEFIQRQLIVREALKKNIEPTDDEIRRALEAQHKQTSAANTATSSENPDQNLATLEGSERRIEIFNDLLTLKFYQTEVLKDVKVTSQEVEGYYSANQDRYQGKNGFYVREIRVREEPEAVKLYRQALTKPGDFAVLAKENSEAPTAASGGLIYYEAQQLPAPLEQAITPLKVGTISRVVKSSYGFHIFKLEQRAEPLPLEKVRKEIEDKLLEAKNQALIDEFNKRALAGARINIYRDRLGFKYIGNLTGS
ncbi:MAG: peptidyl-prolyl cis-trans isomerase [Acidobacteria bacterium]|nr:peptidyl-prolyl cis-trans isomerase [Acidobacteriota bacterium]